MEPILKSDIFFFISTIIFAVIAVLIVFLLSYLLTILKTIQEISVLIKNVVAGIGKKIEKTDELLDRSSWVKLALALLKKRRGSITKKSK